MTQDLEAFRDQFLGEFEPGERLLWGGRPRRGSFLPSLAYSLVSLALALAASAFLYVSAGGPLRMQVAVALIGYLPGALGLLWILYFAPKELRNAFAISDRRFLKFGRRTQSMRHEELVLIRLLARGRSRSGHLDLLPKDPGLDQEGPIPGQLEWLDLPDVETVAQMAQKAVQDSCGRIPAIQDLNQQ